MVSLQQFHSLRVLLYLTPMEPPPLVSRETGGNVSFERWLYDRQWTYRIVWGILRRYILGHCSIPNNLNGTN